MALTLYLFTFLVVDMLYATFYAILGNTTISGFISIVEPVCGGVQPSLHEEGTAEGIDLILLIIFACLPFSPRLSWFCLSDETNDLKINQCRLSAPVA